MDHYTMHNKYAILAGLLPIIPAIPFSWFGFIGGMICISIPIWLYLDKIYAGKDDDLTFTQAYNTS